VNIFVIIFYLLLKDISLKKAAEKEKELIKRIHVPNTREKKPNQEALKAKVLNEEKSKRLHEEITQFKNLIRSKLLNKSNA
jgi:hypothetical protein